MYVYIIIIIYIINVTYYRYYRCIHIIFTYMYLHLGNTFMLYKV